MIKDVSGCSGLLFRHICRCLRGPWLQDRLTVISSFIINNIQLIVLQTQSATIKDDAFVFASFGYS